LITHQDTKPKETTTQKMSEERLSVLWVWSVTLGNAPERDGVYKSPFRADRTPSLSVSRNGTVWHDFGTGDGGDAYDFAAKAYDLDVKRDFKRIKSLLGRDVQSSFPRIVKDTGKRHDPGNVLAADPATLRDVKRAASDTPIRPGTETMLFMKAKRISRETVSYLYIEGSLGSMGPWPAFLYEDGVKIRYDHGTSRSARWLIGTANSKPWRGAMIREHKPSVIVVFEGESDLMFAMSCYFERKGTLYIAAPSASWRPSEQWIKDNLSGADVITAFDYDAAGRTATQWWVKNAKARFIDWRKTSLREGDDFSKLPASEARKLLQTIKKI